MAFNYEMSENHVENKYVRRQSSKLLDCVEEKKN